MRDMVEVGKAYLSGAYSFPGQVFVVKSIEASTRFGKDDYLVRYTRWAFNHHRGSWYSIETTSAWFGEGGLFLNEVPANLMVELSSEVG